MPGEIMGAGNENALAFSVSFDPAALLPELLKSRRISVLDDRGSSVLLELRQ